MLHRKCQFVKLWEKSRRLDAIIKRLWVILRDLDDCGLGSCKMANRVRRRITEAKRAKAILDSEINLI